jgi:hypothetical protein
MAGAQPLKDPQVLAAHDVQSRFSETRMGTTPTVHLESSAAHVDRPLI